MMYTRDCVFTLGVYTMGSGWVLYTERIRKNPEGAPEVGVLGIYWRGRGIAGVGYLSYNILLGIFFQQG